MSTPEISLSALSKSSASPVGVAGIGVVGKDSAAGRESQRLEPGKLLQEQSGPSSGDPGRPTGPDAVIMADVRVLLRLLVAMVLMTGALAMYLWARMEVTELAVNLDQARSDLGRAEVTRERLRLERAVLRQPATLADQASQLGLVAPEHVIDLQVIDLQVAPPKEAP